MWALGLTVGTLIGAVIAQGAGAFVGAIVGLAIGIVVGQQRKGVRTRVTRPPRAGETSAGISACHPLGGADFRCRGAGVDGVATFASAERIVDIAQVRGGPERPPGVIGMAGASGQAAWTNAGRTLPAGPRSA